MEKCLYQIAKRCWFLLRWWRRWRRVERWDRVSIAEGLGAVRYAEVDAAILSVCVRDLVDIFVVVEVTLYF